ncbi:hypothetical protein GCM10027592_12670 [Spirosoma flavus]
MSNIIKVAGIDYDGEKFVEAELIINLAPDGDIRGAGKPITLNAAKVMIDSYLSPVIDDLKNPDKKENALKAPIAVYYGKETLMLLLSQSNCEGIRFYFCKNHHERASLVLIGIDKDGSDLGIPIELRNENIKSIVDPDVESLADGTLIYEVGGPDTLIDLLEFGIAGDPVGEALKNYIAKK